MLDRNVLIYKIRRTAAWNGGSIVAIAGLAGLIELLRLDWLGVFLGVAFAAGGWLELVGRRKLPKPEARQWLLGAQAAVFGMLVLYSAWRLLTLDAQAIESGISPQDMQMLVSSLHISHQQVVALFERAFHLTYISLIIASFIYQGGMALYYRWRLGQLARA